MSWQWRKFWCVDDNTSVAAPENKWVRTTYRKLRLNLNASVAVLVRKEHLRETHAALGATDYDVKVRHAQSPRQLVELDICTREIDGIQKWHNAVSMPSVALEPDSIIRRRVLRECILETHPEVVRLFDAQKERKQHESIASEIGNTIAINVHTHMCRSILITQSGIEIEIAEIVVRHGAWRSLWRTFAIDGDQRAVLDMSNSASFRAALQDEVHANQRVIKGGFPSLTEYIVAWVYDTSRPNAQTRSTDATTDAATDGTSVYDEDDDTSTM